MKRIHELSTDLGIRDVLPLDGCPVRLGGKNRINIIALGDVGTTILIGLRLLGSDVISEIGICDIRKENISRLEQEINQISYPFGLKDLPSVHPVDESGLFDCDALLFCASKGVPPVDSNKDVDVRMLQLEANSEIIDHYAKLARDAQYKGLVCVVSDPVDNLCAAFLDASELEPWQFHGFGLGVMNARALYHAEKDPRFASYAETGRALDTKGKGLVIANSITDYNDKLSRELTDLTVDTNMTIRDLGFKPYIAPALSSAAISLLLTLQSEWHYGSVYLGDSKNGAFLGIRSRLTRDGFEYEDAEIDDRLYERIKTSYMDLCGMRKKATRNGSNGNRG